MTFSFYSLLLKHYAIRALCNFYLRSRETEFSELFICDSFFFCWTIICFVTSGEQNYYFLLNFTWKNRSRKINGAGALSAQVNLNCKYDFLRSVDRAHIVSIGIQWLNLFTIYVILVVNCLWVSLMILFPIRY